jgi:hypothetical protein
MALAEAVTEAGSARALVRVALDRRELLVAHANGEVVGVLVYRTDWFGCTRVGLVSIRRTGGVTEAVRKLRYRFTWRQDGEQLQSRPEEDQASWR